jgi:hypothetical protein
MSLTKTQTMALSIVRSRIDPADPMFSASDDVEAGLNAMRPYLDSWVWPLLDYVLKGERYCGQADEIRRDYASRGTRRASRERQLQLRADARARRLQADGVPS